MTSVPIAARLRLDAFAAPEPAVPRCDRCNGSVSWTVDVADHFDPHGFGCCAGCGTLRHVFLTPEQALRVALDSLAGTSGVEAARHHSAP